MIVTNVIAIVVTVVIVLAVVAVMVYCFVDPKQLRSCYKSLTKPLPFARFQDEEEEGTVPDPSAVIHYQNNQISGNVFTENEQNPPPEENKEKQTPYSLSQTESGEFSAVDLQPSVRKEADNGNSHPV